MKMRKLVLTGVLALVVIGCVLVAGCTSDSPKPTVSNESWLGAWQGTWQEETGAVDSIMYFRPDGKEYWMSLGNVQGIKFIQSFSGDWAKESDNVVVVTNSDTKETYRFTYDAAAETLTSGAGLVYTRPEPIVGIWVGNSTNGKPETMIIKPNGKGLIVTDSGMERVVTWVKNTDGKYAVVAVNNQKRIVTVSDDGNVASLDDGRTKTRQHLDSTFFIEG